MNKRLLSISTIFAVGMMSCQKLDQNSKSESSHLQSEVVGLPNGFKYPLGSGYVSKSGTILNTACINPAEAPSSVDVVPYPEGKLQGGFSESRKTIIDKFSMAVSASANVGTVSGSGSSSIDVMFAESALKTASYLTFDYRAGNVYLRDPRINPVGKGLLINHVNDKIAAACGDELVYRVDLGAKFHVGIEYVFASKELKDELKAQLKIKGPAGVTLFKMNESRKGTLMDKSAGTLNLVVYQEGGDLQAFRALSDRIPKNCTLQIDNDGKLSKKGFQQCADYYQQSILPYMQKTFPKQIEKLAYEGTNGLNVLRYYTKRYDEFGFPELQTEIDLPKEARLYKIRTIDEFDRELFTMASFSRSLDLGIGGNPDIARPKELTVDPASLLEIRHDLVRVQSEGRIGLNRCRGLLQNYIMKIGVGDTAFRDFMKPCDADYANFKAQRLDIIQNGNFPVIYNSFL